jgi:TRAP-type C4-dicarboxylate transport system substrate-binding protein
MMDGQENPLSNIVGGSLHEVQTYLTLTGHLYSPAFLVASADHFAALPVDVRTILEEEARATQAFAFARGVEADSVLLARLLEAGMEVNEPDRSSFERASRPMYLAFGEAVSDGLALVDSAMAVAAQEAR